MITSTETEPAKKESKQAKAKKLDARSLGRELTMQFLFQIDICGENLDSRALACFWKQLKDAKCFPENRLLRRACEFAEKHIAAVKEKIKEIDEVISKHSKNWTLQRMNVIDRNLLRIGVYEILYEEKIPPFVTISEVLRIADKYGTEDSQNFINGILHSVVLSSGRKTERIKKKG